MTSSVFRTGETDEIWSHTWRKSDKQPEEHVGRQFRPHKAFGEEVWLLEEGFFHRADNALDPKPQPNSNRLTRF